MKKSFPALLVFLAVIGTKAFGQHLTADETRFLRHSAVRVCEDATLSSPNWELVAEAMKGKKMILIGEFNHGSREVFQLRNDFIKYLHGAVGAKVILFELGLGELAFAELNREDLSAAEMANKLVGVWRTAEFVDLMAYAKKENISIAGFDVQRSGGSFVYLLKDLANKQGIDSLLYGNLEQRYGILHSELSSKKANYDSLQQRVHQLIADYKAIYGLLNNGSSSANSKEHLLVSRTVTNRMQYLSYMLQFTKDRDWSRRWAARDLAMAENIEWLSDNIYKDETLLMIGHNYHISRYSENEQSMGEVLAAKYGEAMYAIGVFAGGGAYADNSGKTVAMLSADTSNLDIKHIIGELGGFANFMDIPNKVKSGSEWLHQHIVVNDSFIDLKGSNTLLLSQHFDGLLLLEKVSPAVIGVKE